MTDYLKTNENLNPIGVFDSGLGGLTVLKELIKTLPHENFIYLADTANVPYGEKNIDTILTIAHKNINFLISKKCKLICVACGTISSLLSKAYFTQLNKKIPIFGIVEPVCQEAVKKSNNKKIGIIATNSAINSGSYLKLITKLNSSIKIFQKGCPKFVDIIENGLIFKNEFLNSAMQEYLSEMRNENIDTLILGCTHFPIIEKQIDNFFLKKTKLINPGIATSVYIKNNLKKLNIQNEQNLTPTYKFFISRMTPNFQETAEKILNKNIDLKTYDIT